MFRNQDGFFYTGYPLTICQWIFLRVRPSFCLHSNVIVKFLGFPFLPLNVLLTLSEGLHKAKGRPVLLRGSQQSMCQPAKRLVIQSLPSGTLEPGSGPKRTLVGFILLGLVCHVTLAYTTSTSIARRSFHCSSFTSDTEATLWASNSSCPLLKLLVLTLAQPTREHLTQYIHPFHCTYIYSLVAWVCGKTIV